MGEKRQGSRRKGNKEWDIREKDVGEKLTRSGREGAGKREKR